MTYQWRRSPQTIPVKVLRRNIKTKFHTWSRTLGPSPVNIHKVIVIDPFGSYPVLMTDRTPGLQGIDRK